MQINASMLNLVGKNDNENKINNYMDSTVKSTKDKTGDLGVSFGSSMNASFSPCYPEEENTINPQTGEIDMKACLENLKDNIMPDSMDLMEEMGVIPDKDDPSNVLTVAERIKIELATHCDNYKGDVSNISAEDIKEMGGMARQQMIKSALESYNLPTDDKTVAEVNDALSKLEEVTPVKEETAAVLLKSADLPTIEKLYEAEHSVATVGEATKPQTFSEFLAAAKSYDASAHAAKNSASQDSNWEALKEQVEELLNKNNIEANEDNLNAAKYLVSKNIPVTVSNILDAMDLKNIDNNEAKNIENIVRNMAYGTKAEDAQITSTSPNLKAVKNLQEMLSNLIANPKQAEAKIQSLVNDEKIINLRGLEEAKEGATVDNSSQTVITAKTQLLEISLMMSAEAGIKLMKAGIRVELEPLENLLEKLGRMQKDYYAALAGEEVDALTIANSDPVNQSLNAMKELSQVPAYVLGYVAKREIKFTLEDINKSGNTLAKRLEKAGESYETMGTEIRGDLGDSIVKAFKASEESILKDLGMEATDKAKKAVRILGFNRMEITKENIDRIKCLESEVEKLEKNLTPAAVVKMLKEGINPLNTDIFELNDSLKEMNEEYNLKEEQYASFLWKLDNAKEAQLSPEEREAYIGIYRTMHLMQKDNYQALGYLVNSGAELTIKNMVNAIRAKRAKGMKIDVDDTFEALKETAHGKNLNVQLSAFEKNAIAGVRKNENNDDRYIERLSENLVDDLIENMNPEGLKEVFGENYSEMSLERFSENFAKDELNKTYKSEYEAAKVLEYFENEGDMEALTKMLEASGQLPSLANQAALRQILSGRAGLFKNLEDELDNPKEELAGLADSIESEEELDGAVDNLAARAKELLEEKVDTADVDTLDLKNIKLANIGLALLKGMSSNRNFQIPIDTGDKLYAVNLTVIEGSNDTGKIKVEFEDENFGLVKAEIKAASKITSDIYFEKATAASITESIKNEFEAALTQNGFRVGRTNLIEFNNIKKGIFSDNTDETEKSNAVKTKDLFTISKAFLTSFAKVMAN